MRARGRRRRPGVALLGRRRLASAGRAARRRTPVYGSTGRSAAEQDRGASAAERPDPLNKAQATMAGAINSASLFFGVFTRLLTGVATMWVSGYWLSNFNAPSGFAVSHASRSYLARIAGMRCFTL